MNFPGVRTFWRRLRARFSGLAMQDCPPELSACEVCRRLECSSEEWLKCERRLAAERRAETGGRSDVDPLKLAWAGRIADCAAAKPDSRGP